MVIYDLKTMHSCDIHENTVVALGTFDGCHAGHMSVFNECRMLAHKMGVKSAVYTFSSSPKDFFTAQGASLFTLDEKIKAIRKCGIDYLCIEDFVNVAHIDGERFLEDILVGELHAVGACCGFNFRFGKGASLGAVELQAFFENRGGCVRICDKIVFRDRALSSSLLRELVENGDLEALLAVGHPYSVYAKVEHGKELGRTIGIPTINQKIPPGKVIPAKGVYITECEIGEDVYPSITNVGVRPTVESDGKINMETHIIGFDGNLYGSHVRVNFYKRLRDERSFSSLDELCAEIEKNILSAISYFK
ncbi:MAG: riboflavin biosynthesis protein RibF [Clostridia bacterium]|nr:riboflavin biosynthesis protein RibF [Clostridia bacterium]